MVISRSLSVLHVVRTTWRVDLFIAIICTITYLVHEYVIPRAIQLPVMVPTLLGTALAFFVGFNNNQAYDRWWEARIIWGALVNDSRTWARHILQFASQGTLSVEEFEGVKKQMIAQHIGFVYALKDSLRGKPDQYYKRFFSAEEVEEVTREKNVPNAILTLHAKNLQRLADHQCIDPFRFMQFNSLITAFTDHMGKSERIRTTVFPTIYIYFTRLFIWVLVIFVTIILADTIGGWAILIGWVLGFVFHVSHQNGMLLMEPFDKTPTGIPLNQISRTIEINLLQMVGETDVPEAVTPINGEFVL